MHTFLFFCVQINDGRVEEIFVNPSTILSILTDSNITNLMKNWVETVDDCLDKKALIIVNGGLNITGLVQTVDHARICAHSQKF